MKKFVYPFILTILIFHNIQSQELDSLTLYPNSSLIIETVHANVNYAGQFLDFEYAIENSLHSEQNIYSFLVEISTDFELVKSPNMWRGNFYSARKRVISWGSRDSSFDVKASELLSGFVLRVHALPNFTNYFARGYVEITPVQYGKAPELAQTEGADIFQNSKKGLTLGPWLPDSTLSLDSFTDTLETFRYRSCEELGWATDTAVCGQLEESLSQVKISLLAQDSVAAANALSNFIELVEQEKDASLTSEGYALLYFNADYLRAKLVGKNE